MAGSESWWCTLNLRSNKEYGCEYRPDPKCYVKNKGRHKDRWLSAILLPYERAFAHHNEKVRGRGLMKVQFPVGVRAIGIQSRALNDIVN